MSLSPSPLYATPLSSVGYSTELPAGYRVHPIRGGYEVISDEHGVIEDECGSEFDTYEGACYAAQDHAQKMADIDAAEAAALAQIDADNAAIDAERDAVAYQDELSRLYSLIDTRQSTPWGDAAEAKARHRAVTAALAAIDALSQKAA